MTLRSQNSVWWPNITLDIEKARATCSVCHKNAPMQSPLPPVQPPLPQYPFELVSTDYFQVEGNTYLVLVDRYSNWPVIRKCRTESADELVQALREYFSTYGVPREITSDSGMAYVAEQTQTF